MYSVLCKNASNVHLPFIIQMSRALWSAANAQSHRGPTEKPKRMRAYETKQYKHKE